MNDDIVLSPVMGWESATIPAYNAGFFMFHYLVSPMERPEQAHSSPRFALTEAQLRELGQRMLALADALASAPQSSGGAPTN